MSVENDDNTMVVSRFSDFHTGSIYYKTPEKTGKTKVIRLATPAGDPILVETPRLKVTRVFFDEEVKENGYVEFYFPADSQDFYDFMTKLDDHHMQMCHENSKEWFNGRDIQKEFIEGAYKTNIIPPRKAGSPCRLRVRLPVKYNKLRCSVYNQHHKPMSNIQDAENMNVLCILRMVQLEVCKSDIQCVWELEQMKVFEKRKRLTECYIRDIPEDEKWLSDEDEDFGEMDY